MPNKREDTGKGRRLDPLRRRTATPLNSPSLPWVTTEYDFDFDTSLWPNNNVPSSSEDFANARDPRDTSASCVAAHFDSSLNSAPRGEATSRDIGGNYSHSAPRGEATVRDENENCLMSDSSTHATKSLSGGTLVYSNTEPVNIDNFLSTTFISDSKEPSPLPQGTSGPAHELVSSGPAHALNNYRKAIMESDIKALRRTCDLRGISHRGLHRKQIVDKLLSNFQFLNK